MPYSRKRQMKKKAYRNKRLNYKKKYYRPITGRRYSTVGIARWKNPLPHSGYYKMKYCSITQMGHLTIANNYTDIDVFNANSMYDPEEALGGGQPMGFDQFCGANAPFNRYKVVASKITVNVHNTNDTMRTIRVSVLPTLDNTMTQASFIVLQSMPNCKQIVMENQHDTRNKVTNYMSTKRIWAQPLGDGNFAALYNSNPGYRWYWQVVIDGSTQAVEQNIKYDIEITYYCQLTQTAQVVYS